MEGACVLKKIFAFTLTKVQDCAIEVDATTGI